MTRLFFLLLLFTIIAEKGEAQHEKSWIKRQVKILSGKTFNGRGYVGRGSEKAANYIARQFKESGVLPFTEDSNYTQSYTFPVNTFPGDMTLKLRKKELTPGADYLVNASSVSFHTDKMKLKKTDLKDVKDTVAWQEIKKKLKDNKAYFLKNYDTVLKYLGFNSLSLGAELPRGLFIIPKHGKLIWTVLQDTIPATVFIVEDTVMPRHAGKVVAHLDHKFFPSFENKNVLGFVPGTKTPDSFIVFCAHFDHLGMMGRKTMFPGAHDNASGTSLMLYLANYFAQHPANYSVAFMSFSGEEAGLMGSEYYVEHPVFPLNKISMVVNLDMTGDATDGIMIVNATEQKEAVVKLDSINRQKNYLPAIKERKQAANSDHYSFSQKNVPAIFIYGLGAKGFYHDVFDKANELSFTNIDQLAKLLIEFAEDY